MTTGKMMSMNRAMLAALKLSRGAYQEGIVAGNQRLSGADLRGKARSWAASYFQSRTALFERIYAAGIPYITLTVAHGKEVVVFGSAGDIVWKAMQGLYSAAGNDGGRQREARRLGNAIGAIAAEANSEYEIIDEVMTINLAGWQRSEIAGMFLRLGQASASDKKGAE